MESERRSQMYQFTEDCMTGIQEIDEEHSRLFQMLNEAMALVGTGADSGN